MFGFNKRKKPDQPQAKPDPAPNDKQDLADKLSKTRRGFADGMADFLLGKSPVGHLGYQTVHKRSVYRGVTSRGIQFQILEPVVFFQLQKSIDHDAQTKVFRKAAQVADHRRIHRKWGLLISGEIDPSIDDMDALGREIQFFL